MSRLDAFDIWCQQRIIRAHPMIVSRTWKCDATQGVLLLSHLSSTLDDFVRTVTLSARIFSPISIGLCAPSLIPYLILETSQKSTSANLSRVIEPQRHNKFEVTSFSHCTNIKWKLHFGSFLVQDHAHFSSRCDFVTVVGKPQLHAKFEVFSISHCRTIKGRPQIFWELP